MNLAFLDSSNVAVLHVDLQGEFTQALTAEKRTSLIERTNDFSQHARTLDATIIWICNTQKKQFTNYGNFKSNCSEQDGLDQQIVIGPWDTVFEKNNIGAFYGLDDILNTKLKSDKIDTLLITGLFADCCVRGTIEGALRHNFNVYAVTDLIDEPGLGIQDWHAKITDYMTYKGIHNHLNTIESTEILSLVR